MKSRTITIIDYGMGNVRSLYNAFNYLGAKVKISEDVKTVSKSNIAILPGVGSFNKAMKVIKKNSLDSAIKEIISRGDFLFCICLGMQLLAKSSNEEKYTKGLQIIPILVITPLTFLGGSFYSITMLPEFWQNISLLNPVLYLISGFRYSFYEVSDVSLLTSIITIFTILIGCIFFISYTFIKGYKIKN